MPSPRWNYVDVKCKTCQKQASIRIDQYNRKGCEWVCRSCARTGIKCNVKKPSAKHDPIKLGAYKSYYRAKKRVQDNHKNCYGHVQFLFKSFDEFLNELGPRPDKCTLTELILKETMLLEMFGGLQHMIKIVIKETIFLLSTKERRCAYMTLLEYLVKIQMLLSAALRLVALPSFYLQMENGFQKLRSFFQLEVKW